MILLDKVKAEEPFNLGGYAGTGKTTQIKAVYDELGEAGCYIAPTNAAAHVLREKGIPATTLHRLIYHYDKENDTWHRRTKVDADFIICDEASMLTERMFADVRSFGVPSYFVGDPFQLPPVDGPMVFEPDFTMTEVRRHGGRILRLATQIREEGDWEEEDKDWDYICSADMVICGYNKTRHALNCVIRENRGFRGDVQIGDEIMYLNNTRYAYNGMTEEVKRIDAERINGKKCRLTDKSTGFDSKTWPLPITFAYARTCHKAQGDQADRVAVIAEPIDEADRWMYTAVTRARKKVRIFE